tara:strand:- start:86 stop:499 length:414 start_codon:yes stop_codon:yes gene_type:complete
LRSKFGNRKVELDGCKFDSLAEARHYHYTLKPRLDAGEITHLEMQTSFQIEIKGKKICKYKADFQYFDCKVIGPEGQTGALVVEDVKGMRTAIYRLKKKLVEAQYPGTKIIEVPASKYRSVKYALPLVSKAGLKKAN